MRILWYNIPYLYGKIQRGAFMAKDTETVIESEILEVEQQKTEQPSKKARTQQEKERIQRMRLQEARLFENRKHKILQFFVPRSREQGMEIRKKQRVAALMETIINNATSLEDVNNVQILIAPRSIGRNIVALRNLANLRNRMENQLLFAKLDKKEEYIQILKEIEKLQGETTTALNTINKKIDEMNAKINTTEQR